MKNLLPKPRTNFNLYVVLTICSILIGIPTEVVGNTIDSHQEIPNTSSPSAQKSLDQDSNLLTQKRIWSRWYGQDSRS